MNWLAIPIILSGLIIDSFTLFPAAGGGPPSSNVELFLDMDGTDTSTTFTDESSNAHSVTANGNAQVDTAQSKYGGASLLVDGTGDYLSIADDITLRPEDKAFTIEFWYRPNTTPASQDVLVGKNLTNAGGFVIWLKSTQKVEVTLNGGAIDLTSTTSLSNGTWYHVAVTRDASNNIDLWIDGTSEANGTDAGNMNSTAGLEICSNFGFAADGHMDDFRFVKDYVVYTETFTPAQLDPP